MIIDNIYDFYGFEESKRKSLIGITIKEITKFKNREIVRLYFPIQLTQECFNYGIQEGLIYLSETSKSKTDNSKWFGVSAFSPDDLDLSLIFQNKECQIRQEVIDFIKKIQKNETTYKKFLLKIQEHFKCGIISD